MQRLREKQYAGRTVETYGQWVERFQQWCAGKGVGLEAVSGPVADPHQPALRLNCRTLPGLADTGSRAESDGHWPARGTPQVAGVACGPPDHRAVGRQAESDINKWLYY